MLQIITIICVTHVQKNFWIRASIKKLLTKYQIFTILPQISHFHKFRKFFKYICNFWDQLLHPYKFYGRGMSGILFFIFASCHPLKGIMQFLKLPFYRIICNSIMNVGKIPCPCFFFFFFFKSKTFLVHINCFGEKKSLNWIGRFENQ